MNGRIRRKEVSNICNKIRQLKNLRLGLAAHMRNERCQSERICGIIAAPTKNLARFKGGTPWSQAGRHKRGRQLQAGATPCRSSWPMLAMTRSRTVGGDDAAAASP